MCEKLGEFLTKNNFPEGSKRIFQLVEVNNPRFHAEVNRDMLEKDPMYKGYLDKPVKLYCHVWSIFAKKMIPEITVE